VLQSFCRKWGVSLAPKGAGKTYEDCLAEVEARFRRRGTDAPRRPRTGDLRLPMQVPEDRPAGVSEYGHTSTLWTRESIIEKLREYAHMVRGARGSQRHYRQVIDQNRELDWPATSTITRHGLKFPAALAEARRRERAAHG
jgi:hypothetical protein